MWLNSKVCCVRGRCTKPMWSPDTVSMAVRPGSLSKLEWALLTWSTAHGPLTEGATWVTKVSVSRCPGSGLFKQRDSDEVTCVRIKSMVKQASGRKQQVCPRWTEKLAIRTKHSSHKGGFVADSKNLIQLQPSGQAHPAHKREIITVDRVPAHHETGTCGTTLVSPEQRYNRTWHSMQKRSPGFGSSLAPWYWCGCWLLTLLAAVLHSYNME